MRAKIDTSYSNGRGKYGRTVQQVRYSPSRANKPGCWRAGWPAIASGDSRRKLEGYCSEYRSLSAVGFCPLPPPLLLQNGLRKQIKLISFLVAQTASVNNKRRHQPLANAPIMPPRSVPLSGSGNRDKRAGAQPRPKPADHPPAASPAQRLLRPIPSAVRSDRVCATAHRHTLPHAQRKENR